MTFSPPPLPTTTATATNNNNISWRRFCDKLLKNKKTKILFIYLCLNTIGLIFQVTIAWTSNSLALLGHAFHTMFDCIGVVVACAGEIYYHNDDENEYFTFGLSRVPVLAAFTNAAFLFFIWSSDFLSARFRIPSLPAAAFMSAGRAGCCRSSYTDNR